MKGERNFVVSAWYPIIISIVGIIVTLFIFFNDKSETKQTANINTIVSQTLTDTIQNRNIVQLKECDKAIAHTQDVQRDQISGLQKINTEVVNIKNTLTMYFTKVDKTLLILLQDRQSMRSNQVDSMNIRNYSYNDSLSVYDFIDNSSSKFPEKKEYDECEDDSLDVFRSIYNLVFQNAFVSPFQEKQQQLFNINQ